jgi:hypothetical protein
MKLTAEISMYPLKDEYISPIDAFIARLAAVPGLVVVTTATATRVTGEFALVADTLRDAMRESHDVHGRAVFVTKFIPGFAPD